MNRLNPDDGLARLVVMPVVVAVPFVADAPRVRRFPNSSSQDLHRSHASARATYNLDPVPCLDTLQPRVPRRIVLCFIGPQHRQLAAVLGQSSQDDKGRWPVPDRGRLHRDDEHQALQSSLIDMALAAGELLSAVAAGLPSRLAHLKPLVLYTPGARAVVLPGQDTNRPQRRVEYLLLGDILGGVMERGVLVKEILRQYLPLATNRSCCNTVLSAFQTSTSRGPAGGKQESRGTQTSARPSRRSETQGLRIRPWSFVAATRGRLESSITHGDTRLPYSH